MQYEKKTDKLVIIRQLQLWTRCLFVAALAELLRTGDHRMSATIVFHYFKAGTYHPRPKCVFDKRCNERASGVISIGKRTSDCCERCLAQVKLRADVKEVQR